MRERVCFVMQVRADRVQDYLRAHEHVWPDMLEALRRAGWANYSLFVRRADGLVVGYLETDDFEAALARMDEQDVNTRWQQTMQEYFEQPEGVRPDQGMLRLTEYFHLD
jgi:L-rhamnose mutarotase